jgi:hypothetical protein
LGVSGNFSSVLPFLRLKSGCSLSSALTNWLLATLATLFAFLFIVSTFHQLVAIMTP